MSDKKLASAISRLSRLERQESFDPATPGSRPNAKQMEIFRDIETVKYRYVIAGNQSGKSMLAARELGWILSDTHPFWNKPARWGDEPLLVMIAGQDRKQMEIELWEKKLSLFLDKGDWRTVRMGGILQYAENRNTKDRVVFVSHSDSSDKNRRHMQGYVAHYVWLDEMPSNIAILEELQRRTDAREGYLLATFTPKFRNDEIRRVIDGVSEPLGKKYRMSKLDNPLYKDRIDQELEKLIGYSESYKKAILYGDWYTGDSAVYEWTEEMVEEPIGYSYAWRHVESVDPALKSKFGFTLWAEEPSTGKWYLVKDEYIEGIYNPEDMFKKVQEKIQGYNVIRRICDPHEAWYIGTAAPHGVHYSTPYDKNSRKGELIKGLQAALSSGKIKIAPWCGKFKQEVQSCQWSENSDANRIVNSSSYHLLDTAQYFVDCMPAHDPSMVHLPWHEELRKGNQKRKQMEEQVKKVSRGGRVRGIGSWGHRRRTK